MKCPCGMSLGKVARSTSRTEWPLRASNIAVLAPAQRAPTTMASYICESWLRPYRMRHTGLRGTGHVRRARHRAAARARPRAGDHARDLAARGATAVRG